MSNEQKELAKVIERYFGADAAYLDIDCFTLARRIMEAGWTKAEIVRCKDCCWSAMATPLDVGQDHLVCCLGTSEESPVVRSVDENNFCSAGERREADA